MKKALAEDKRDIEQGDFRPGTAAGNVEDALAALAAHSGRELSTVRHAILEAACLVSGSDGNVDDAERDVIRRAAAVLGASAAESDAGGMLSRCLKLAQGERILGRSSTAWAPSWPRAA